MSKRVLSLLCLSLAALPLSALTLPSGPEVTVKSGKHHNLRAPATATSVRGEAVVVWSDDNLGLRARVLGVDGVLRGEVSLVPNLNHPTTLPAAVRVTDRKDPVVIYDAVGNSFFAFWTNEIADLRADILFQTRQVVDRDVFGQRFDRLGHPMGDEFPVNTQAAGYQSRPQVTRIHCEEAGASACADGALVVAWEADDLAAGSGPGEGVFGRRFNSVGVASSNAVRLSPLGAAKNAALTSDARGNLLALWDAPDGSLRAVFALPFTSQLRPLKGNAVRLSEVIAGSQGRPAVAYNASTHEFLAVWQGNTATDRYASFGRLLTAAGPPSAAVFPLTVGNSAWEVYPLVVATSNGGYTTTWLAWDQHFPTAVRGVALNGHGVRVGAEFDVSENRPDAQSRLSLTAGRPGTLVSTFEGFDDLGANSIELRWLKAGN